MTEIRRGRGIPAPATSATATVADADSTAVLVDRELIGDQSIWAELFSGRFRLAVRCERCGRWLTAGPSKKRQMGAHCAAKAVI